MRRYRKGILLGLGLVGLTLGTFGSACCNEFVNYDDLTYVCHRPEVVAGISWHGIAWAFTALEFNNWHPLTWISYQLDQQLFGPGPFGYHLSSVVLHAATVVAVFAVLRRMTGAVWRSAIVAAFFAVHPQRVESVAWISERKDVLSGLFGMLTLWFYVGYAARPHWLRYVAVVFSLALGLMAKPMLVTFPCLLCLLDWWPLRRFPPVPWLLPRARPGDPQAAPPDYPPASPQLFIAEKLPLFLLSWFSGHMTTIAQVPEMNDVVLPLWVRVGNALLSYLRYIEMMFWPFALAPEYPHPGRHLPIGWAVAAGLAVLAATVGVLVLLRSRPYLAVGWFWYVGTLLPVIGLVQVGDQAMADRYTYIPSIGILLLLTWGAADLLARWPRLIPAAAGATVVLLAVCVASTWHQISHWHDSKRLWEHASRVNKTNPKVHISLGNVHESSSDTDTAILCYLKALEADPENTNARAALARGYRAQGRKAEAAVLDNEIRQIRLRAAER